MDHAAGTCVTAIEHTSAAHLCRRARGLPCSLEAMGAPLASWVAQEVEYAETCTRTRCVSRGDASLGSRRWLLNCPLESPFMYPCPNFHCIVGSTSAALKGSWPSQHSDWHGPE